ncbi:sensor histidine kinase [Stutzerimonas tarimensis]|uniref:histidine kinase n=1 Tax=Stutzerimonas tarimensis TaxID=1507735 RepID=A0ABV7T8Y3_9GAMM
MAQPLSLNPVAAWRWPWRQDRPEHACERLLLELSTRLLGQPDDEAALSDWLSALQRLFGAQRACLLLPEQGGGLRELGDAGDCAGRDRCPWRQTPTELPDNGGMRECPTCRRQGRLRLLCGVAGEQAGAGALLLELPSPLTRRGAQDALTGSARQLGMLLEALAQQRQQRRRELTAERGALSRDLHDSVAQQLSYLQIRVSRLRSVLDDPAQADQAPAMLDDLRDTLRLAHRQVRELIATARLTMDGRSLRTALEASVDEFARRSSCVFELDNRLPGNCLSPEAELQILQVVREALANVVRHAHARQVQIRLAEHPGWILEVLVQDDGIGLPEQLAEDRHFGLRIMRERVTSLGAQLTIGPAAPQGTRIHLIWRRA